MSEEALQIAEERRDTKGKRERNKYTQLKPEFQRIARRDKKAFLSEQCKEIEENNRMGKTSDLFKKIRDNKGTLHAEMSTIKDRNDVDLTEADGEGNGSPLQCSCLESPMDRGAWRATVHGVAKSRTRMSD